MEINGNVIRANMAMVCAWGSASNGELSKAGNSLFMNKLLTVFENYEFSKLNIGIFPEKSGNSLCLKYTVMDRYMRLEIHNYFVAGVQK